MSQIQDGAGGISWAKVDTNNRLWVNAESFAGEEIAAQSGDSFIVHGVCHLAASTDGGLLSIKNTSANYDYHVTRIYVDPHSLTPSNLHLTQQANPTVTNGSTTTITILNKNLGSGDSLVSESKLSNAAADLTFASGTVFHDFLVASKTSSQRNMVGTNVITPGKTWGIGYNSTSAATDGETIGLSVNLYRRKI